MKKLVLFFALLTIISLAVFANGSGEKASDTYKIALYAPLTGNNAQYGLTYKATCEIYRDKVNAAGGINGHQIELVVYDDKNDQKEALTIANKIVSDPSIVAVIGSQTSSPTMQAATVFAETGIPMISPQASHANLTPMGENIFSLSCLAAFEGGAVADMMIDGGHSKVAVIYGNDDYGLNIVERWTKDITDAGIKVVDSEMYIPGQTTDFTPLISKIKASGAEALYIEPSYADASMILTQMKQLDCQFQAYGCSMLYVDSFLDAAGDAAEGLIICNFFDPNNTDPVFVELKNAFSEKTGKEVDVYATHSRDAFMLFCDAIAAVGTDPMAITDWLTNVKNWPGACGPITFDETRHPDRVLFRFKVVNGQFVSIGQ